MGWWHPYFFGDTAGVQVLFQGFQVASPRDDTNGVPLVVVVAFVLCLCCAERLVNRRLRAMDRAFEAGGCGQRTDGRVKAAGLRAAVYMAATALHFMVMLVVMSFNGWLFVTVLLGLGATEFGLQLTATTTTGSSPSAESPRYHQLTAEHFDDRRRQHAHGGVGIGSEDLLASAESHT